jgi:hypothetical protein
VSPELEVLDQLDGGDLPLHVIADLFPELTQCSVAIGAMLSDGLVRILDSGGTAIPHWRFQELKVEPAFWGDRTTYRMTLTEIGAKRIA